MKIGNLEIDPPLALAPMVGLSHSALRSLLVELGGVGLFFTEMLSAKRLPSENETISPYLIRSMEEWPLFYQLFLNDWKLVETAVEKLHTINANGIDINFGCPAPKLRKQGAGSVITEDFNNVSRIVRAIRNCTNLPVTVKIRLGCESAQDRFVDLCKLIESEGADCLTIHARFNGQKFCRKPNWSWIGSARKAISIPIIANGGIFSVEDAKRCLYESGADGLMLGRGAVCKPWIFSEICNTLYNNKAAAKPVDPGNIYRRFVMLLIERFAEEKRLGRLKQFTHYYATLFSFGHQLATNVQTSSTIEQALDRAEKFFSDNTIQL